MRKKMLHDDKIVERRKKLANLYHTEMESWKAEALSKIETPEERKLRYNSS
jgi:hypothetical protein